MLKIRLLIVYTVVYIFRFNDLSYTGRVASTSLSPNKLLPTSYLKRLYGCSGAIDMSRYHKCKPPSYLDYLWWCTCGTCLNVHRGRIPHLEDAPPPVATFDLVEHTIKGLSPGVTAFVYIALGRPAASRRLLLHDQVLELGAPGQWRRGLVYCHGTRRMSRARGGHGKERRGGGGQPHNRQKSLSFHVLRSLSSLFRRQGSCCD